MHPSAMIRVFFMLVVSVMGLTHAAVSTTISWSDEKQEIDGFGASTAWLYWAMTDAEADDFFSPTKGIGLSLVRVRVSPGSMTGGGEITSARKAIARGAKVWGTPWTPPANFKSNNNVNKGGILNPTFYGRYADNLVNYVKHMKAQGVDLYALSLQNEPDLTTDYESCRFDGEQLYNFLKVIGPKFTQAKLTTKLMLPESYKGDNALADKSLLSSDSRPYAGLIGQHMYGGYADYPLAREHGVKTWQTEMATLDTAWDPSITDGVKNMANWLHTSLVTCSNSAYHHWWIWSAIGADDNSGLVNGINKNLKAKRFWIMGNYSRFVRPGWKRIQATTGTDILVSAYKDPITGAFAVVATNTTQTATPLTLSFAGATPTSVTPWVTNAADNLAPKTAVTVTGGSWTYTLTPTSVTTFVGTAHPGKPTIIMTPNPVRVNAILGVNPPARTIAVSNFRVGTLTKLLPSVTYQSGNGWLGVNVTGTGNNQILNLQFTSKNLPVGTYTATIQVKDSTALSGAVDCPIILTVAPSTNDSVAINAGGPWEGRFVSDQNYSGGSASTGNTPIQVDGIANAAPPEIYQSSRFGAMTYTIPNFGIESPVTVRLHFVETYHASTGARTFNVAINGNRVLSNFDIYDVAKGKNIPVVRDFAVKANADGAIVIDFSNVIDNANVNAIEIFPRIVVAPPVITTPPANRTVTAGQTATFSVVTAGTAPFTYQWKRGSVNVGTNSATLTITNAQTANAGSYTCVVSNSAGTVTTTAVTLTVITPIASPATPVPPTVVGNGTHAVTLSGVTQPGVRVHIWVDSTNIGTALANDDGTWNYLISNMPDGTHLVSVTLENPVGTSPASDPVTVHVVRNSSSGSLGGGESGGGSCNMGAISAMLAFMLTAIFLRTKT